MLFVGFSYPSESLFSMSLQTLLSGAAMNVNARINRGTEKMSPTTGTIKNPKKASPKASGSNIRPITRLEYFSVKQFNLFILDLQFVFLI
jgi:hypothetical protein